MLSLLLPSCATDVTSGVAKPGFVRHGAGFDRRIHALPGWMVQLATKWLGNPLAMCTKSTHTFACFNGNKVSIRPWHVLVRTWGSQGGTEGQAFSFVQWLRAQGQHVEVHCLWSTVPSAQDVQVANSVARGRLGKHLALQRLAKRLPAERSLGYVRAGAPFAYRSGGGGIPQSWNFRRPTLVDKLELAAERKVVSTATTLVVNSQMAKSDFINVHQLDSHAVAVVYNAVDTERFRPVEKPRSVQTVLGFIGNDLKRKGLDVVIELLASMPSLRLAVLSSASGAQRRWAKKIAEHHKVSQRIEFCSGTAEQFLTRVGVLVLPTHYDPCANSCLEALASGVPVITTPANGASELLPELWWKTAASVDSIRPALEQLFAAGCVADVCRNAVLALQPQQSHHKLWSIIQNS